jgi:alkanesulfonate monooxygenase SsuD/methylene tetrahydromethanopterin reductase-like flavin-dependent oxidoreductase (luciferase family)
VTVPEMTAPEMTAPEVTAPKVTLPRVTLPRVTLRVPHHVLERDAASLPDFLGSVERGGIDGVCVGDHVSFRDGAGYDGLVHATALAVANQRLDVWTAVYLLALRHPVTAARQVASLAALAPGRFVFGIGLGGDDPHELEVCGVDPRRRGRRLDTSIDTVRSLLAGEAVTVDGDDFRIPGATIRPVPDPAVPIIVGGRSGAALRRAARSGDGWISVWMSASRVGEAITTVRQHAAEHGREGLVERHCLLAWCGFGATREAATPAVAAAMESLYKQPFANFARYVPRGSAQQVATELAPYVDAGVRDVLLIGIAEDDVALVEQVAEVRRHLHGRPAHEHATGSTA